MVSYNKAHLVFVQKVGELRIWQPTGTNNQSDQRQSKEPKAVIISVNREPINQSIFVRWNAQIITAGTDAIGI